jgi:hypothetical protein
MIVGQISFGPQLAVTPVVVERGEELKLSLGLWKLLGLGVDLEPVYWPAPCFDVSEMRRRNSAVGTRRTLKCN